MYILKQIPEDFVVKEISEVQPQQKGRYAYFQLWKRELGTLEAIQKLARIWHVQEKDIGVAGNKDKKAVTEQTCSLLGKFTEIDEPQLKVRLLGYGNAPISLGNLQGNHFEIVIRNLDQVEIKPISYFPNYFDEQRFSGKNVQIGKHLLKKEFKQAAEEIDDYKCKQHLQKVSTDYVGALKEIPARMLRMYLNAYQSYIWNETLSQYLRQNGKNLREVDYSQGTLIFVDNAQDYLQLKIPLLGFNTAELEIDPKVQQIMDELMQKEKIDYTDFIIKQIPMLTLEGEMRSALTAIKELKIGAVEKDELNTGKKKVKLCFDLGKGSYATMVIKSLTE